MSDTVVRKLQMLVVTASMAVATPALLAQATPAPATTAAVKTPVFDVVSIRPNKSASDNMSWETHNDSFSATNISPMSLLMSAYGMREDQISGASGWVDSARFDIKAKIVDPNADELKKLTNKQREEMLQAVLANRFKLKAHIEPRTLPVYELVIAKGGLKMKEARRDNGSTGEAGNPDNAPRGGYTVGHGEMIATALPVSSLSEQLAQQLQRTVLDKTGLTANYDFKLNWAAEGESEPPSDSSSPSIFTALQEQLGLKLQSSKGPVDTLVIDHVEMPSDNEN